MSIDRKRKPRKTVPSKFGKGLWCATWSLRRSLGNDKRHSVNDFAQFVPIVADLTSELTVRASGQTIQARSGVFVNLPVGSVHAFKYESTAPATMLITVAPSGFEKFLEEFGTVLSDEQLGPIPVSPDKIARLLAAAPEYGNEFKLPA
ncbi:MAG TPA: hypothetical protein VKX17_11470 [Planctomycetota bacterium]|nr:hypothetical protein [Planctomycetota bacterium]